MDPLIGIALAVVVGWVSIMAAIVLPLDRWVRARDLRLLGAASLTLLGLGVFGVPVGAGHLALLWAVGIPCLVWRAHRHRRAG